MIEWLGAKSYKDVGKFYDEHYQQDGASSFTEDRRQILELLRHFSVPADGNFDPNSRLLDAGCGNGQFLQEVSHKMNCAGVEVSKEAFLLAKQKVGHVADLRLLPMEEIPDEWEGAFDYVTSLGVLEHTMDPRACFKKLFSCLKPGGMLLVTVPIEFPDCLRYIRAERNQNTNERFDSVEGWTRFFGADEEGFSEVGEGEGKHVALIYRRQE